MKQIIEQVYSDFSKFRNYSKEDFERDYGRPEPYAELYQVMPEFKSILEIFRQGNFKSVLEIGQWEGAGLFYWLKHSSPDARVYGIDPVQPRIKDWSKWDIDTTKLTLIDGDSTQPEIIESVSKLVGELDFLFIDGCHYYDAIVSDYNNYGKLVKKGGIIVIHDINCPACKRIHVCKAWQEIKVKHSFTKEFILNPFPDFMEEPIPPEYSMGHYGIGLILKEE